MLHFGLYENKKKKCFKLVIVKDENNDTPCLWCTLLHLMLSVKILIVSL